MAKLITKFKYIKPGNGAGSYLKYIATREGVEKIDDSKKLLPTTAKQKILIAKLLRDFPDSREMLEYEDYRAEKTIGAASEFITRAIEDNAHSMMTSKTYADYIATRPRAERFGSHGLFTDDGVEIKLTEVSEELNRHEGNVWTAIVSLRREDAERLGFNRGARWRDMLRTQTQALSENLKIPMENLRWYAAFHNESHHPHVHLIAYSLLENEGYLTKKGVENLRSSFARDIFAQDLLSVYEQQTEHRDALRAEGKKLAEEIAAGIHAGSYDNPVLENKLTELAGRLARTGGKKVYGYLKADVKDLIDNIVDELAKDERIASLYREILAVADENGGKLKNRCVFFCDEFGTLPKIESAEMMFSASRSRRLQIVPIIQSFSQLEKNYGKEGAEIIIDNTQLTIFGGFAPQSTSAETLSKALGSCTVMSGSVSRSKNDPSESLQMIERPLMTPDELKSMPKGQFVVMKTGFYPMKVKLKLFFKWGIRFDEEHPYSVPDQGNRRVEYAEKKEIMDKIVEKYRPDLLHPPMPSDDDGGAYGGQRQVMADPEAQGGGRAPGRERARDGGVSVQTSPRNRRMPEPPVTGKTAEVKSDGQA